MNAIDVEALRKRLEELIVEAYQGKAKRTAEEEINYYGGIEIALRQVVGLLNDFKIPNAAVVARGEMRQICYGGRVKCGNGDIRFKCPFSKEAKRDERP